jgi:uncharacterized membrane protein required for colicin V production
MKKNIGVLLGIIILIMILTAGVFALENTVEVDEKIITFEEKEIIAHLDVLENYEVLMQLDFLENYPRFLKREITEVR